MICRHPDLDAAVSIERRGQLLLLDFLARGRSQKRAGGKVVGYTTRNPDRRQLVDHVLSQFSNFGLVFAKQRPGFLAVGSSGGKGGPYAGLGVPADDPAVRRSYSASGNYRWSLWLRLPGPIGLDLNDLAFVFGLVPDETHRPVKASWPPCPGCDQPIDAESPTERCDFGRDGCHCGRSPKELT
jgi:hypothetical protein